MLAPTFSFAVTCWVCELEITFSSLFMTIPRGDSLVAKAALARIVISAVISANPPVISSRGRCAVLTAHIHERRRKDTNRGSLSLVINRIKFVFDKFLNV